VEGVGVFFLILRLF